MKYSIIIPCYNSAETIKETIYSIPRQEVSMNTSNSPDETSRQEVSTNASAPSNETSRQNSSCAGDIEIIVVDNGSKDNSLDVINEIKKEYPNIVLTKESVPGAGAARKRGVSEATGDYLIFLDSDDLLAKNAFEIFDEVIKMHPDFDVIRYKNTNFLNISDLENVGLITVDDAIHTIKVLGQEEIKETIFTNEIVDGNVSVSLWGKIYKREQFLENVSDYGHNLLEDYYINMQYYLHIKKCVDLDVSLYWYRESLTSTSHKYYLGSPQIIDTIHSYKLTCMHELQINTQAQINRANDWLVRFCLEVMYHMKDLDKRTCKKEYQLFDELLKKNQAYTQLDTMKKNKDAMILKTRSFFIIYLYYKFRWRKK